MKVDFGKIHYACLWWVGPRVPFPVALPLRPQKTAEGRFPGTADV